MPVPLNSDFSENASDSFSVICLCAEWCDTCRKYQTGFDHVSAQFPDARFAWLDIEDHGDALGDIDIESFPTLLINRGDLVLYFGVMLPHPEHLARILESFCEMDAQQSRHYALGDPERRRWQDDPDLMELRKQTR